MKQITLVTTFPKPQLFGHLEYSGLEIYFQIIIPKGTKSRITEKIFNS